MIDILGALLRVVAAWVRRAAIRIALALVDRLDTGDLTRAERAWLVGDVEEDLATQIDDAEQLSISATGSEDDILGPRRP